jgi:type IV secretory pathway VirB2 component (pilin)
VNTFAPNVETGIHFPHGLFQNKRRFESAAEHQQTDLTHIVLIYGGHLKTRCKKSIRITNNISNLSNRGGSMKQAERPARSGSAHRDRPLVSWRLVTFFTLAFATPILAQNGPWEQAVQNLQVSFTGPIAKGLSLVAVVVGGLMFAYSEGASKKVFAGIIFGLGMALGAATFMTWMFG